ncbi:MAG: DNA recombination protein RmuC [Thermodesulfobacteriota bacterium]
MNFVNRPEVIAVVLTALFFLICVRFMVLHYRREAQRSKRAHHSSLQEKNRLLDELQRRCSRHENELERLRKNQSADLARITELSTRLEMEEKRTEEKLALVVSARDELLSHFQHLAGQVLEERHAALLQLNRQGLDDTVGPLSRELKSFQEKVETIHIEEVRQAALMRQELDRLAGLNSRIGDEALRLTQALKGDKRLQGAWGEMILGRVLEQSGLRENHEFEQQSAYRNENNELRRPDVIVHLPDQRDVIIDSKVSLVAWEEYVNGDEKISEPSLKRHLKALKTHIDGLAAKDYPGLLEGRTLDFVLMFIPVEASLQVALQKDATLLDHALEKKIVLVGPTTLLAALKTIENLWRIDKQNRNTGEVVRRAAAMHDKFCTLAEDLDRLSRQLTGFQASFDIAMNRISRGRGNLVSQAATLRDLGVKVKKKIPESLRSGETE